MIQTEPGFTIHSAKNTFLCYSYITVLYRNENIVIDFG